MKLIGKPVAYIDSNISKMGRVIGYHKFKDAKQSIKGKICEAVVLIEFFDGAVALKSVNQIKLLN